MIISHAHDFGFVHIPKCAGSTIRHQLRDIDDLQGAFFGTKVLPDGRQINGNHVPLQVLKVHYPEAWDALCGVTSYVIVRDPMGRFLSAMAQYLRGNVREAAEMRKDEILSEALQIIATVTDQNAPQTVKHAVFYPQVDFVYLEGQQVITHVVAMDDVDLLFDRMTTQHDLTIIRDKVWNPTVTYRVPAMSGALNRVKDISKQYLPMKTYVNLRELAVRTLTTKGVPKLEEVLQASGDVQDFVSRFYAEDATLYQTAKTAGFSA